MVIWSRPHVMCLFFLLIPKLVSPYPTPQVHGAHGETAHGEILDAHGRDRYRESHVCLAPSERGEGRASFNGGHATTTRLWSKFRLTSTRKHTPFRFCGSNYCCRVLILINGKLLLLQEILLASRGGTARLRFPKAGGTYKKKVTPPSAPAERGGQGENERFD